MQHALYQSSTLAFTFNKWGSPNFSLNVHKSIALASANSCDWAGANSWAEKVEKLLALDSSCTKVGAIFRPRLLFEAAAEVKAAAELEGWRRLSLLSKASLCNHVCNAMAAHTLT